MTATKPFLRWAGGKRWLAPLLASFFTGRSGRYFEPFLGSGSIFFAARPTKAVLADVNQELITLYSVVRNRSDELLEALANMPVTKDNYYRVRQQKMNSELDIAARMLFLNRTAFNGLYRVNRNGEFNVPFGDRHTVNFIESGIVEAASNLLKEANLFCCDFQEVMAKADKNDVVYCDPVYTVKHNDNGFIRYNEQVFSWADQIRLRSAASAAVDRGAVVLVSNAMHSSVRELYRPYHVLPLSRRSPIGKSAFRGDVVEALFVLSNNPYDRMHAKRLLSEVLVK